MSEDGNSGSGLSTQLAHLLKNGLNIQPQNPKLSNNLQINLKLNSQNYALWTRMIRVGIGGKSKNLLKHLSSNPPNPSDETYEQWEHDDLIVFSWLIHNIEPTLASNLTEFPTAKTLWDTLVVTYGSGKDKLHTYNLHVRANDGHKKRVKSAGQEKGKAVVATGSKERATGVIDAGDDAFGGLTAAGWDEDAMDGGNRIEDLTSNPICNPQFSANIL